MWTTVQHSNELGRYLIASQDIEPRTKIIYERPLVSGPADDDRDIEHADVPMCLGCCKRMTECPWVRCVDCGWPVCGGCSDPRSASPHMEFECPLFRTNQITYSNTPHTWPIINKTILILRTLLLKKRAPDLWDNPIMKLEHHNGIRQTKPYCRKGDEMILENFDYFNDKLMRGDGGEDVAFSSEDIIRVSGVINVNAFTSTKSVGNNGKCVRLVQCICPEASLLAHSCIPNSSWTIEIGGGSAGSDDNNNNKKNDDLHISIRSTTHIKKGEMITIAYNIPELMSGTLHRLISTEDVAHFICKCRRCEDPTEMGTFLSGIRCFDCGAGYLLPECPTDPESGWRCYGGKCKVGESNHLHPVQKIVLFLTQIEESYERIKLQHLSREAEVSKLENFLKMNRLLLHENHYILQEVRMRIINLQVGAMWGLGDAEVERFVGHCKRVMTGGLDVVMPGFSQGRATLQFFLSQGLLRMASLMRQNQPSSASSSLPHHEESNKDNNYKNLTNLYKDIHYLQTRALLYFTDHQNHSSTSVSSSSSSGANYQFVKCIKGQLEEVEKQLYTDREL